MYGGNSQDSEASRLRQTGEREERMKRAGRASREGMASKRGRLEQRETDLRKEA